MSSSSSTSNAASSSASLSSSYEDTSASTSNDSITIDVSSSSGMHLEKPETELSVVFRHLSYEVDISPTEQGTDADVDGKKLVLNDVSGEVNPGEILAVMGPTGSGKTSLLSLITGRIKNGVDGRIDGDLLINGNPVSGMSY
eukprot:TRINITY_DN3776_c0_g1_i9.p1 TRINITY_DN3776_c0_g1~~TRINITY_DN3776_c0_g1_i9.p1  ORF type:complete len:142 (-),score=31.59 TRINITY_DN3776_c0_g1_i9:86-511(-)